MEEIVQIAHTKLKVFLILVRILWLLECTFDFIKNILKFV